MKNVVANWLFTHGNKRLPAVEWANLLLIKVLDPDGWRERNEDFFSNERISIIAFLTRLRNSTINVH
jgi:hypothetical protein